MEQRSRAAHGPTPFILSQFPCGQHIMNFIHTLLECTVQAERLSAAGNIVDCYVRDESTFKTRVKQLDCASRSMHGAQWSGTQH